MVCEETVKAFCKDFTRIENYGKAIADTTQTYHCHHRLETHNSDGERRLVDITRDELIALGMYYDRPPEELIFLTRTEHKSLHLKGKPSIMKGKVHSEGTKRKMSGAHKGKKLHPHTEEAKRKMSEAFKGKHWKLVDGKRVWY